MKMKLSRRDLPLYFILIPFFHPRGFDEYFQGYKLFFTLWIYLSAFVVIILFLKSLFETQRKYNNNLICLIVYFVLMLGLTLLIQGSITEGLQKLLVAPILCLMCAYYLNSGWRIGFLRCLANILIVIFFLNLTLFNPVIWSAYFAVDNHLIFLGHVQVAAQLGIVGVLVGYLLLVGKIGPRWRAIALIVLSVMTMIMSETSAALIVLAVLLVGVVYLKLKPKLNLLLIKPMGLMIFWICANFVLILLQRSLEHRSYVLGGIPLNLSGRMYIWKEIIALLQGHWVQGYGVYGVKIKVFWHGPDSEGMNYAHNQLFQLMLDGGVLLLIAFAVMMYVYIRQIDRVNNKKIRAFSNLCLLAFLLIMLTESVTEYYFFYVFLSILGYMPKIVADFETKRRPNDRVDHNRGNHQKCERNKKGQCLTKSKLLSEMSKE